jgi:uncharacterized DUF497 family protein
MPRMALRFKWDPRKAKINQTKHDVSFDEAMTVFADPLARIFPDEEHSANELREIIIGNSATDEEIRIISARKATPRERKNYEENVR